MSTPQNTTQPPCVVPRALAEGDGLSSQSSLSKCGALGAPRASWRCRRQSRRPERGQLARSAQTPSPTTWCCESPYHPSISPQRPSCWASLPAESSCGRQRPLRDRSTSPRERLRRLLPPRGTQQVPLRMYDNTLRCSGCLGLEQRPQTRSRPSRFLPSAPSRPRRELRRLHLVDGLPGHRWRRRCRSGKLG
jgi:hypothetical protein